MLPAHGHANHHGGVLQHDHDWPKSEQCLSGSALCAWRSHPRNSSSLYVNSMIVGWKVGIRVDGKLTNDHFNAGEALFNEQRPYQ